MGMLFGIMARGNLSWFLPQSSLFVNVVQAGLLEDPLHILIEASVGFIFLVLADLFLMLLSPVLLLCLLGSDHSTSRI